MPALGSTGSLGYGRMVKRATGGLQKTVGGVTYTLIAAHKAFNYPTTPYPGPSDSNFRVFFTSSMNRQITQLSEIWALSDGTNFTYSNVFNTPCTGYLMEAYNPNGTQFPVWATFDTSSHTWQSLQTRTLAYGTQAITTSNAKLYSSTDTSVPRTVGFVSFLTTSYNGAGATDWSTDTGDAIFMGVTTAAFSVGDAYDTTFNQPSVGTTSIGFALSDGSGTNITMATYGRRSGSYKHCTAVSNGTAITTGRVTTSHGGADSMGFFLIWGKF